MQEETKTAAQIVAERIKAMPLHKDYAPVDNMPIPLHKDLLIKKTKQGEWKTKAGIVMATMAENIIEPDEGIVMAIGPMCSEMCRVGLKYKYSKRMDSAYIHDGEEYVMADETALRYVIPSDDFRHSTIYKSDDSVRRGKKMVRNSEAEKRIAIREANEEDERKDTTKGKIRKLK
jgi:co-chaperonin GroES (HSP10)